MRKLVWLLRVCAVIILTAHIQAHPALSTRVDLQLVKMNTGLRQLLWMWGEDEEVTEQPATYTAKTFTIPVTTFSVFTTTKKPSRWRWWLSSGDEKKEVEEVINQPNTMTPRTFTGRPTAFSTTTKKPSSWRSWLSGAASKVKDELLEAREAYDSSMAMVGNAIVAAGNATKEGILGAGRAIKKGAKRIGSAVKAGFRKVRLRFAGSGEKFRIVVNRLKEKLEAGDESALALMKKLGINVSFFGSRITGSSVEDSSLPVSEILKNEGLFSNKSASYNTAVERPDIESPGETAEERLPGSGDLHPDPDDEKSGTTITMVVTSIPPLEGKTPPCDTKKPNLAITTVVPNTKTKHTSTITQPASTTTRSTDSVPLSTTTRLQTTTRAQTTTKPVVTATHPPTTTTHPPTTTIKPVVTITHLPTTATHPPTTSTRPPTTTTHLPTTRTHPPTTTTRPPTTTTHPPTTRTHPPTTTTHPPTTRTYPPTTTTHPPTTRTYPPTTTTHPPTTTTHPPTTTTHPLAVTVSRGTRPPATDSTPMVSHPEEPYEPPPFPDVFSDIEVHDRLKAFYDNGDFSHAELAEIFNFDPDNYEYYYDY